VLAHERQGDGGGEAAERARVGAGVYEVPCARVGEAGLVDDVLEGVFEKAVLEGGYSTLPTN
jgi:hypothetical protein